MLNQDKKSPLRSIKGIVIALGAASLLLTGCGIGDQAGSDPVTLSPTANVPFKGNLHGGPNPVVGATVKLYATGSSTPGTSSDGYGIGTLLAEANNQSVGGLTPGYDTNANGDFSFSSATYTCPAKQFAYLVASGGNPGAGTNNALVLVAAIGRCEDLTTSTTVYINELTTVAAGYALGHFASVTGTTPTTVAVGIGAPITNNSQHYTDANGHSAGCISNTFYGTTACPQTVAAGLYHAFLNAATLMPTGTFASSAATAPPAYTSALANPVVNFRLMNAIGNALAACVNSSGSSSPACTTVFGATTIGGVAPTNTFQAMINLAANPTLAGTTYTPTTFLNASGPATNFYTPVLANYNNLQDFEMSVYYPAGSGTGVGYVSGVTQGLYDAWALGLDINDTLYVGSDSATGTGSTSSALMSFSSQGALITSTPTNTTVKELGYPSPDGLGNVYTCGDAASAHVADWTVTAGGVISSTPVVATMGVVTNVACSGLAVDQASNVWASTLTGSIYSSYNVFEFPAGGFSSATPPVCPYNLTSSSTTTYSTPVGCTGVMDVNNTGITAAQYAASGVMVDPNQNIWVADQLTTAAGAVTVLQNTGTVTAPAYTFQSCITGSGSAAATSGTPCTTQVKASTTYANMGGEDSFNLVSATSSSGYTVWADTNLSTNGLTGTPLLSGIQPFVPTLSGAEVQSVAAGTFAPTVYDAQDNTTEGMQMWSMAADGAGNVFTANKTGNQWMMTTPSGTNIGLWPCTLKYGTTSTGCTGTAPSNPVGVAIDSTGTVWMAAATSGMYQLIGLGTPVWPQLSLGKVGKP